MSIDSVREQLQPALAGRYAIEREFGRGGMATVHLARDARHDRLVALKVLNPELGRDRMRQVLHRDDRDLARSGVFSRSTSPSGRHE